MAALMPIKATTLILLVAALLFHIHGGDAVGDNETCQPTDISITTAATGRVVGGLPEQEVTVANQCSCPQAGLVVSCPGGAPAGADASKIRLVDSEGLLCLVNSGWPIVRGSPVTFTYAGATAAELSFYGATPRCP